MRCSTSHQEEQQWKRTRKAAAYLQRVDERLPLELGPDYLRHQPT